MDTSTFAWTFFAVVTALVAIGALAWMGQRRGSGRPASVREHDVEDGRYARENEAGGHAPAVDVAAANARAVQTQADAKAVVAARLKHGAEMRREEARNARAEVMQEFVHADQVDPKHPEKRGR